MFLRYGANIALIWYIKIKEEKVIKSLNIKNNKKVQKYLLPLSVCTGVISFSLLCEASSASSGSVGVIKTVIENITTLIKNEGKLGLQFLSAAAGGVATAKTVSWQPLLIGAGGAGVLEIIFQAIG